MDNSNSIVGSIVKFVILVIRVVLVYLHCVLGFFRNTEKKSVRGLNVLITGSGHGLGREMAIKFADLGANLILVDINEANNELVKQELINRTSKGAIKVLTYSVDIREESKVAELEKNVSRELGSGIDILINNAGIVQCLPFLELASNQVEKTFQVNVLAHIWTIKHFLPGMLKRQRGHIVAISSIAGLIGGKFLSDYCASKFAVVGLMDSLDKEIHDGGANPEIYLTTVCPSCMSTGMFKSFTSRFDWLLPILKADEVAANVVDAVLTNKPFIVIPAISLFFQRLSHFIPSKVTFLIQEYLNYGVRPHSK